MDLGTAVGEYVDVLAPELPVISAVAPEQAVAVVVGLEGPPGPPGNPDDVSALIATALDEHVHAPTPHTAYDVDMPRLDLIFENGLI